MTEHTLATPAVTRLLPKPGTLLVGLVVIGVAVVAASSAPRVLASLLTQSVIVAFLALGVGLLIRVSGLVSFGHAAPFGLGAYGAAWALSPAAPIAPEIGLLLIAPAIGAAFFLIGLVVSRIEGIAFGMLTLALGQAVHVAANKFRTLSGGSDGLIVDVRNRQMTAAIKAIEALRGEDNFCGAYLKAHRAGLLE